ncbi:hypothetical protein AX774_g3282 [Zancudomyces culisetae]|uniref:BPL/LPL catalytic domain-containing protein n=1 Tax=Zancudomyces culisetae TaxID=1213189 RepID=A0A1R1PQH1_ZANCU|nr:hypothetical protein AX774_g3282 [Zancudomyces culisetae]|eukprot:OMH83207.1 hypothetical protein AX774_g3282 [Zancudomyces culisetae]
MWVSPPGCLQFSILFKHPQSSTAPAVMLQYLMTLAVVEAVRSKPGYQLCLFHCQGLLVYGQNWSQYQQFPTSHFNQQPNHKVQRVAQ